MRIIRYNVHFVDLQLTIENLDSDQVASITNRFSLSETLGVGTTLFSDDATGSVKVIVTEVATSGN